jgi:8-oxo-dGTP pyrophosphatase MutT (NUDIX family)
VEQARARREEGLGLKPIRAAGGILVRARGEQAEVLLVHRPRYDDWSFPKGKARAGEPDEDCARREVEEETGLVCDLGSELPETRYVSGGRAKRVRYWLMTLCDGEPAPRNEIDAVEWLRLPDARERLSYEHDRELLDAIAGAL